MFAFFPAFPAFLVAKRARALREQKAGEKRSAPGTVGCTIAQLVALATLLFVGAWIMPVETAAPMSAPKPLSLIVACSSEGGIGKDGQLPWRIPGDMAYFKRVTTETTNTGDGARVNAVIMGRKTWDSIPARFRPLPGRVNVVLSRNAAALELPDNVLAAASLSDALAALDCRTDVEQCFIIGGGQVYKEAWHLERLSKVYRTLVHGSFECDAFIPADLPPSFERDPGSPCSGLHCLRAQTTCSVAGLTVWR